jgi:hypothetical protein
MATYLQGVTDYIPQIQPFKPDLNFYQGVLETKQAQYKAGYDQLSNLYGTMLNSELSRTDNTERRDQFFNKIQTDIQKISGLDLSRNENVEAAQKVFQPILDDKYILKDMSFTKSYRREQGKADYFMNCTDPKTCGGKYWEGGVRALDYQRQDFMEAGIDQSLGYQNPMYTPYVNVDQMAQKWAKDMNYKIKLDSLTGDGRYKVTTTNGPQMVTGLTEAFVNAFANDPSVNAMYKTQAYLQRKDYVSSNAERFGGDKMAAEKDYLVTEAGKINEYMRALKAQAEKDKEKVAVTKQVAKESEEETPIDPNLDKGFADMINGLDADEQNAASVEKVATDSLDATDGIDYDKMSLEALRYRIDVAQANQLLYGDLGRAAESYAMNTMEQTMEVDPYAMASYEHGLRMSEISYKASLDAAAKQKEKDEEAALEAEYQLNAEGTPVDTGDDSGLADMQKLVEGEKSKAFENVNALQSKKATEVFIKLRGVLNNSSSTEAQKALAKNSLQDIFGSTDLQQIETSLGDASQNSLISQISQSVNKILGGAKFNIDNADTKIDAFVATGGNGLFRGDEEFTTKMLGYNTQIAPAKQMALGIDQASKENNAAIKQQMYVEGGDDIDIFFNEDGSKKSLSEFTKIYNQRHPTKASWTGDSWWNIPSRAVSYAFVDSAADTYEDLEEQYKKIYNGGKVKINTPYQAMDKYGASGLHAKATMYTMDPAQLGGMRTKTKELYEKDIAPSLYDPARGNARFFMGDISGKDADDIEDLEIDSEEAILTKKIMNDVMRSAFTTKWKGDKAERPTMDIVRHGMVGGDPDKVGVTFSINQNYIDNFKGSAKEKGLLNSMYGATGNNKLSVIMDKDVVSSTFFKELEPTPIEYVFNSMGSIKVDAFAATGGTATITRASSGEISVIGALKFYDPVSKTMVDIPNSIDQVFNEDADINEVYRSVGELFYNQNMDNVNQSRSGIK